MQTAYALTASVLGATGVLAGAFAAHALRGVLSVDDLLIWETAARYQLIHAVAMLAMAVQPQREWRLPALLMGVGTIVFSGSLYLLVLAGPRWLGAITPVGGSLLILAWLMAGKTVWHLKSD